MEDVRCLRVYYPARHDRHIRKALSLAAVSTERQRHGALISKGNRVIAVGINAHRNDPLACTDPRAEAGWHAEEAAIKALPPGTDCSRLTIYSTRIMRDGTPGNAKPCQRCAGLIESHGFKEVIYT